MACKLVLAFAFIIVACSSAGASPDRYFQFSTGEEGHKEQCFVKFALRNEVNRYAGEAVVAELRSDLKQLSDKLEERLLSTGRWEEANSCTIHRECFEDTVHAVKDHTDFGGSKFRDAKCARFAKFNQLCEMVRDIEPQMLSIEQWVCLVRDENRMDLSAKVHKCQPSIFEENKQKANEEFDSIVAFSPEQLEKAKQALVDEIAAEMVEKAAHDAKVAEGAFESIKNGISKFMPAFKSCIDAKAVRKAELDKWAEEENQKMRDREVEEAAEKIAREEKYKAKKKGWYPG